MSVCANCKTEISSGGHKITSFLSVLDKEDQITVLHAVTDLFGAGEDNLRQFIKTSQLDLSVPVICKMCLQMLENCLKWRNQFWNLCHPKATLWPLLFHSKISHCHYGVKVKGSKSRGSKTKDEKDERSKPKPRPRLNCSVMIKRLPYVYLGNDRNCGQRLVSQLLPNVESAHGRSDGDIDGFYKKQNAELYDQFGYAVPGSSKCPQQDIPVQDLHSEIKIESVSTIELLVKNNSDKSYEMSQGQDPQLFDTNESDSDTEETQDKNSFLEKRQGIDDGFTVEPSLLKAALLSNTSSQLSVQLLDFSSTQPETRLKAVVDMSNCYEKIPCEMPAFNCGMCNRVFQFRAELMTHVSMDHLTHSTDEMKTLKCPQCEFQSTFQFQFTSHMFSHTRESQYRCIVQECNIECGDAVGMRKHCANHFKIQNVPSNMNNIQAQFMCAICNKIFTDRSTFHGHFRYHTLVHACPVCGQGLKCPSLVATHMKNAHGILSQPAYRCRVPSCDYSAVTIREFQNHFLAIHRIALKPTDNQVVTSLTYECNKRESSSVNNAGEDSSSKLRFLLERVQ